MTAPSAPENPENVAAFLAGLSELTDRHQLSVTSCGCCASPWIQPVTSSTGEGLVGESLEYNTVTRQYMTDLRPAAQAAEPADL